MHKVIPESIYPNTHRELFEALLAGEKITKVVWQPGEYLHLVGDKLMEAVPVDGQEALLVIKEMSEFRIHKDG